MRIVCFYHSLLSDWNHGNAHFLRGIVGELMARGHEVAVFEPRCGWSLSNLLADYGLHAIDGFHAHYPGLVSESYDVDVLDLDRALEGADLVLVHEWSDPALVRRIGEHRRRARSYVLLFHDTHHRLVSSPASFRSRALARASSELMRYDLRHYDGVLAFGEVLRALYLERGLTGAAFTWHEAADVRVFKPYAAELEGDLVWIGNWGDGERSEELREYLLGPVRRLGLGASVHGVRYPDEARIELGLAGVIYHGFLPNYLAPRVFARHSVTVHVPRRPYVEALPGVPTIRVFEALACGIPLISAPWEDAEGLFSPGRDFLVARSGHDMEQKLRAVLHEPGLARALSAHGLETIRARHTCAHRVDELLAICRGLGIDPRRTASVERFPRRALGGSSCQPS